MEILVRGIKPCEREHEAMCRNCGTVVRFKQSEGLITRDQRDGDFITVPCPVCEDKIHSYDL